MIACCLSGAMFPWPRPFRTSETVLRARRQDRPHLVQSPCVPPLPPPRASAVANPPWANGPKIVRVSHHSCGRHQRSPDRSLSPAGGAPYEEWVPGPQSHSRSLTTIDCSREGPTPMPEIRAPQSSSSRLTYTWVFLGKSSNSRQLLMSSVHPSTSS